MKTDNQATGDIFTRVTWNTTILVVAQVIEKAATFFLVVLLVRYLSEIEFGRYGFVLSYVVLFNVFIGLGLAGLSTREISRDPGKAPKILTAAFIPMLVSSLVTFVVIRESIIWTKPGQAEVAAVAQLAALALILNSFTGVFAAIPRAHEQMLYVAVPKLVKQVLMLLFCLVALPMGVKLVGVFFLLVLTSLIELLLQVVFCRRVFRVVPDRQFDAQFCYDLLRESFPLALVSIFVIIYYKIDSVMLSYMKGDRHVGLYTVAYSLAFVGLFMATSYHQATYPLLSKLYVTSREELRRVYRLSMKYLAIFGLPISAGMVLLAPRLTVFIFGERYVDSTGALQILMAAFLLMVVNGFMGNTLIAAGSQRYLARIAGVGAFLNVGLNLLIIPRYGIAGAAATTVATELFAFILLWTMLRRHHDIVADISNFVRPLICCALMSLYVAFILSWSISIIVVSSAFAYLGLLFISGAIGSKELHMMKSLFEGVPKLVEG
jgi:O-antigen/teichoic acid export membrane protein